jgi:Kef-type K+ transport system membrane component KefB/mannitol/fructose-specific phosphotransferase system IIA component (Ntr-type)
MTHAELTIFFLSMGLLLGVARLLGEVARHFGQPAVLGEILAGIILGPTILGTFSPEIVTHLFPASGPLFIARDALSQLAIVLFLLVAGMEVDLSLAWKQGRTAGFVSVFGMAIPFALGFAVAYVFPGLLSRVPGVGDLVFATFFATAMSISALPVICKILMDLNLLRTEIGVIVVASAVVNDLLGWVIFAIVLSMISPSGGHALSIEATIGLTLAFAAGMMTVGRWAIDRALPWLQAHLSWPSGVLGFAMTAAFFAAAFTEWIGIHAIFGAFLFGVALGDSRHLRERTRTTIEHFISSIFAPIFFASIGLKVNFFANFNLVSVLVVCGLATFAKVWACSWGARLAGLPPREASAVGWGMNARGAMEIILGLLALNAGIIGNQLFVSLVVMALVTSMTSGTMMRRLLRAEKPIHFADFLQYRAFVPALRARDRWAAIEELAGAMAMGNNLDRAAVAEAVRARESEIPTGLGHGVAVPHARLHGLKAPMIGVAVSPDGVDFDSPDGEPSRVIFMLLTPVQDNGAQLQILATIAKTVQDPAFVKTLASAKSYTEFLAHLKAREAEHKA